MHSAVFELFFRTFQETFLYKSMDWNTTYKSKFLRTEPGHKEDHYARCRAANPPEEEFQTDL